MPSAIAAAISPLTTAMATGAATAQTRRARRSASADAEPAARLGISTLRSVNQDDRAWESVAFGGTTSVVDFAIQYRGQTLHYALETWAKKAEGKAVKVISRLLLSLPAGHEYRVIFMQRPLPEVMASQDEMLRRRGTFDPGEDNSVVARAFQDHLSDVYAWLNSKPYVKVNRVQYHAVLNEPKAVAETVAKFLELPLDVTAMTQQVDGTLYRQRRK